MMTTSSSSHTPPPSSPKKWQRYIICQNYDWKQSNVPQSPAIPAQKLRKIAAVFAAEVYFNAYACLQDRSLCSQNFLLTSFSFSFLREKMLLLIFNILSVNSLFITWGSMRVLLFVVTMRLHRRIAYCHWCFWCHMTSGRHFRALFHWFSFNDILLVSSKGLALWCADFFAE